MSGWDDLYDRLSALRHVRRERARNDEEVAERELSAWCAVATEQLLRDLVDLATERAKEFERRTGRVVVVVYPSDPPLGNPSAGPSLAFMKLTVDGATLHLYAHRAPGALPVVHFAFAGDVLKPTPGRKRRDAKDLLRSRLTSLPACVVDRNGSGYVLYEPRGRHNAEPQLVSLDSVVFDAFELLVEELRAVDTDELEI